MIPASGVKGRNGCRNKRTSTFLKITDNWVRDHRLKESTDSFAAATAAAAATATNTGKSDCNTRLRSVFLSTEGPVHHFQLFSKILKPVWFPLPCMPLSPVKKTPCKENSVSGRRSVRPTLENPCIGTLSCQKQRISLFVLLLVCREGVGWIGGGGWGGGGGGELSKPLELFYRPLCLTHMQAVVWRLKEFFANVSSFCYKMILRNLSNDNTAYFVFSFF